MSTIACIVEGHGEMAALPILLRRLSEWRSPDMQPRVPPPIRVHRARFLNRDEDFRRHLLLAANKAGQHGWILILMDADDDCPAVLGNKIASKAFSLLPHRSVAVVLANREYEAWFIAASKSLNGIRNFRLIDDDVIEAEIPRDAKGWIGKHMVGRTYGEIADQAAFTARMDLKLAYGNSRSFRKLCSEWDKHIKM